MSEGIWYEKYRPRVISDMVLPDNMEKLANTIVEKRSLPHLILASTKPGTGKTTMARALCNELGYETLFINASEESGIDILRDKIRKFCSSYSLDLDKTDGMKSIILDECLSENEEVRIGTVDDWKPVRLSDLEWEVEYPVVSYNIQTGELENDTGKLISEKPDELYEVELEDGRTITLNAAHPFMVRTETGEVVEKSIADGLQAGDVIVTF